MIIKLKKQNIFIISIYYLLVTNYPFCLYLQELNK